MKITEKVAYIRGLAEGLELDPSQKEVKVLNAIIDLLDEMAETLTDVHSDLEDVSAQLDEVDEDLGSSRRRSTAANAPAAARMMTMTKTTRMISARMTAIMKSPARIAMRQSASLRM